MKNILIAGPADDPFRIPQITQTAVENSGGQAFFSMDPSDIAACDGVILPGGLPDVDPSHYGEQNTAYNEIDPELDMAQLKMLDTAAALNKPILGICRGHQLLNVYYGGTLIQDVAELEIHRFVPGVATLHDSVCIPGTPLYQLYGASGIINTKHHQAVRKVAKPFKIAQLWFAPGISEQKKQLALGLILLVYALLCPAFLTEQTLGIYKTFRQALEEDQISLLFLCVIKVVLLNCLRSVPNYLGSFILTESLDISRDGQTLSFLPALIPLCIIPSIYLLIEPLYGIKYSFGSPAILLVVYVLVLSHLNLFSVSLPQKIIALTTPYMGIQFLDVVPALTDYGFGQGEISSDIKSGALAMGCGEELTYFALAIFLALVLCSAIHLQLLVKDHRVQTETERNRHMTEDLYRARLEMLRLRGIGEAQSLVHDLKTPLNTIRGLTDLSQMMEDNPLILEYLERISHASEHMSTMVSDILDEDNQSKISVEEFFHSILMNISGFLPEQLLQVQLECPKAVVSINQIRMVRAVVNLLENAQRAVDPEIGIIRLSARAVDGIVQIRVEDNGIGMNQEQLEQAFEIGWSGTGSTGMGLGYVRQEVERQSGTICLNSVPGQGTQAVICLKEVTGDVP